MDLNRSLRCSNSLRGSVGGKVYGRCLPNGPDGREGGVVDVSVVKDPIG